MGLFGFGKKKTCDICGAEIGLLGNRKLADGNMCKDCESLLSVWFDDDDRKKSTVEEIKEQLNYREANKEKVAQFHITRSIDCDCWTFVFDEDRKQFAICEDPRDMEDENPDIIDFRDVTGFRLEVEEDQEEIMREVKKGDSYEEVSYNPPRYKYEYDFNYIINVNNPYFSYMNPALNDDTVEIEQDDAMSSSSPSARSSSSNGSVLGSLVGALADAVSGSFDPRQTVKYQEYEKIADELTQTFNEIRTGSRAEAVAAAAGPKVVTCPFCGAQKEVTKKGTCQFCGGYIADRF